MNRILVALFITASTTAFAQAPAAPAAAEALKPNCGAKPEWPGRLASAGQSKLFDTQFKAYDACFRAYIEERHTAVRAAQAAAKANTEAANAAVAEYNVYVQMIRTEQGVEKEKAPERAGEKTIK
ncbi:hypothetical protein [Usitatibacter palustris]|uniref:Uncharacterized protein n=1 Tax=Usitatibacter palustris TaxID=2732487 RepID=A0A6M4HDC8_9PROT|nr:hypothetical protein [Usitatibacter palustris]QJR16564.1 hypothetical protein DSM104440_03399 [Usitatibacter palustris]